MTDRSIDIQSLPQETEIPVRQSFRVPVSSKSNILAVLQEQTFSVANVSGSGIAILADSCLVFEEGQILEDAQLWLGTTHLTGLTGKVIHCSVQTSGQLYFGIEWQDMAKDDFDRMSEILRTIKTQALTDNGLPGDDA